MATKRHGFCGPLNPKSSYFEQKDLTLVIPVELVGLVAFASLTKIKRQLSIYCFFFQLFFWKLKSDANQTTTQSRQKIHLGPCHLEISTQSFLRQRFWNLEPPITLEAFGRWSSILGYWKLAAFLYCYVRNHLLHGHKFGTFIFSQRFFALGLISELKSQYIGAGHWGVL